jgi:excisionase family DNA binding protein
VDPGAGFRGLTGVIPVQLVGRHAKPTMPAANQLETASCSIGAGHNGKSIMPIAETNQNGGERHNSVLKIKASPEGTRRIQANGPPRVQNAEPSNQKLVNKRVIAHRYGVSERTIQEWIGKEMIPYYKPGYMVRFDPEECDTALNRFKVPLSKLR